MPSSFRLPWLYARALPRAAQMLARAGGQRERILMREARIRVGIGIVIVAAAAAAAPAARAAKAGYAYRAAVGVYRAPQVRVEGEVGYRRAGLDKLSLNNDGGLGAAAGAAPLSGSVAASGHVTAISAMLNAFYDYDTGSAWRPYIDAGIGAARLSMKNVAAAGVPVVNAFDSVFAYQLGLGIGYEVTKSLTLALDYRYFTTLDPTFRDAAGNSFNSEFTSHNLSLGIRYRF